MRPKIPPKITHPKLVVTAKTASIPVNRPITYQTHSKLFLFSSVLIFIRFCAKGKYLFKKNSPFNAPILIIRLG